MENSSAKRKAEDDDAEEVLRNKSRRTNTSTTNNISPETANLSQKHRQHLNIIKAKEDENEQMKQKLSVLYFKLQQLKAIFGTAINLPEIIVIGHQTAGKSSFIEALLRFKFNYVASGLGTQRPIYIQMMNDASKKKPSIYFVIDNKEEENETPLADCPDRIKALTIKQLQDEGKDANTGFTDVPLIIKVYYMSCSNLSIIDTPGLRESDPESKDAIRGLITNLVKSKRDSIIVYVQHCQDDWSCTPIFNKSSFIRQLDPDLTRTFLICSKFNDRLKTYSNNNKNQLIEFLTMRDMSEKLKIVPHFTSIPTGLAADQTTVNQFPDLLDQTYLADVEKMTNLGVTYDEILQYNVGIYKCINELEDILFEKIKQSLSSVAPSIKSELKKKKNMFDSISNSLKELTSKNNDLKLFIMQKFPALFETFMSQINGSTMLYSIFGTTFMEEVIHIEQTCEDVNCIRVLNENIFLQTQSKDYKLLGGAALDRCIDWLKKIIATIQLPEITDEDVANILGQNTQVDTKLFEAHASKLLVEKARLLFINPVKAFTNLIFRNAGRALDASLSQVNETASDRSINEFISNCIRDVIEKFTKKVEEELMLSVKQWSLYGLWTNTQQQLPNIDDVNFADFRPLNTDTVLKIIFPEGNKVKLQEKINEGRSQRASTTTVRLMKIAVQILFDQLKIRFAQQVDAIYFVNFILPIKDSLQLEIIKIISTTENQELSTLLEGNVKEEEKKLKNLQHEIDLLEDNLKALEVAQNSVNSHNKEEIGNS